MDDQPARGGGISHASSLSKRQKVTKALRKSDVAGEEEDDALASILPLRLTTLGGYLPLKDAGRFLFRVSKDMTASIFEERVSLDGTIAAAEDGPGDANDAATVGGRGVTSGGSEAADTEANTTSLRQTTAKDEVWKYLCEQKWRNPSTLDHLVSVLGGTGDGNETTTDWEKLFRKFLRTPSKPVDRASVEDYSFIFSLMKSQERSSDTAVPLSTLVIKGDDAANFLQTGETGFLLLDSPVTLGNYANRSSFLGEEWRGGWSGGIMSTMHVLRKSDGKSCELNYEFGLEVTDDTESVELQFSGGGLKSLGNLEEIIDVEHIECDLGFSVGQSFRVAERERDDGSSDFQISHVSIDVSLFIRGTGECYSEYSRNGATVADFLERLNVEWK